jgi:hypothetical protein
MVALVMLSGLVAIPVLAQEPNPVEEAIQKGLAWLVPLQTADGSWPATTDEKVAYTAFAVVKLEDRAFELGYESPFDNDYEYSGNVIDGLDYIFSQAGTYGAGTGICWAKGTYRECYTTGIVMMAIAASKSPDKVVVSTNTVVNGKTYKQVLQEAINYYAYAQKPHGGWKYYAGYPYDEDNSTTGYAVLGLRYAEYFGCTIPASIKTGQNNWINFIQCKTAGGDFGGSGYTSACYWVNVLKTGNLLFEMSFVGDTTSTQRVKDAIGYIQNKWGTNADPGWRPKHYQAMYCLMKGFDSLDIDTIKVGGSDIDWYSEMATIILSQQNPDGSWSGCPYYCYAGSGCSGATPILCTVWALLTLEKVAPPPPVNVEVEVPQCACDDDGYDVTITYTVERFQVDGTLTVKKDGDVYDTVTLDDFKGTATVTYSLTSDTPEAHTWKAALDVAPEGGTAAHAEDKASINVCETPQVGDIPDQTAPFQTFDLDDYLTYSGSLTVSWSASDPGAGWDLDIDGENVVTITADEGTNDPVTITFTASVTCCNGVVCSDSDDATFIPNQPPDCSEASASLDCLWPPDHKFVDITIVGVTDPDGDPVTINITAITSDEPTSTDKGSGGAKHAPDADGVGTDTASVRAERSGNGDGRVYVIYFTASDGRGGECEGSVIVKVPHDQSDKACPAIDSGQNYDATGIN